jgi:hypothetical protein
VNFSNAIALVALAILVPAVDLTAQRPGFANGGNSMSTSRVVSPAVVASWVSHESFADRTVTSLLVLWRGTPGWFLKGRDYLRCDLELSDPVMKTWMPIICGQMRP